jgi:hypothetical protein
MATLRLGERPWEDAEMPEICMKCGEPAVLHKNKQFTWHPGWVYVLLIVNLIVFAIVAMVLTKKRRLSVPLCAAHRNHWLWRQVAIVGGFAVLIVAGIAAVAALSDQRQGAGPDFSGLLCGGTVVALILWLIVAAVLQSTAIRPTEITDRGITLTGVSPAFVAAYEEQQDVTGRIDDLARERWGRGRGGPSRPEEGGDRVRRTDEEDDPRRPDTFQEG